MGDDYGDDENADGDPPPHQPDEKHQIQDRPNGTNALLTKVKIPASSVAHQSDLSNLHHSHQKPDQGTSHLQFLTEQIRAHFFHRVIAK